MAGWSTEWRWVDNYNNTGRPAFVIGLSEIAFHVEDDGTISNLFLAAASPQGGLSRGLSNIPALLRGPEGRSPTFVTGSSTPLAHDDPTDPFIDVQLFAEATEISAPVYVVNSAVKQGPPGADGAAVLNPEDYGTPQFGQVLSVAAGETDLELTWPKVGKLHLAGSLSSAPDGSTAEVTMGIIDVAAGTYLFDWVPALRGSALTIGAGGTGGTGTDVRVDLIVRKDDETGGNIIGRGRGLTGQKNYQPNIISKVESGTNVITAGEACTLYFRTKKMSGSATYGAANTDAAFEMLAVPV